MGGAGVLVTAGLPVSDDVTRGLRLGELQLSLLSLRRSISGDVD